MKTSRDAAPDVTRAPNPKERMTSPVFIRHVLSRYDDSAAKGRSRERYRRVFLTVISSGFARAVSVSTGLIAVPLTLAYLGTERYGLWMTISSVIAMLGFSDLGISNGLLNGISRAHGKDDTELAKQYISSAFLLLCAVAAALGLLFAGMYRWIPWGAVFRVQSAQALSEAGPAIGAFVGCLLLGMPLGIVSRVQAGYQSGFSANLWTTAGSVLSLISLLSVIHFHGALPLLVLAMAGAPLFTLFLNGMAFFSVERPWLAPSWFAVTRTTCKDLCRLGGLFLALQVAVAVSYSSDNVVLARILGPEAVTQYAIPCRLFSLISALVWFTVNPLWPAYGEALVKRDQQWIRQALRRSIGLAAGISIPLSAVLLIFGNQILRMWVGSTIHITPVLSAGLGIWSVVMSLSLAFAVFFNGLGIIRFQLLLASIGSLSNIALSVYLTRRIGAAGVVYGSILSQTLLILIPSACYVRYRFPA